MKWLRRIRTFLRQLRIESDWRDLCIWALVRDDLMGEWASYPFCAPQQQRIDKLLDAVLRKQCALAQRLGISESAATLPVKLDRYGMLPPPPEWLYSC